MVDINKGYRQKGGDQKEIDQSSEADAETHTGCHGKKTTEQFHQRVTYRYVSVAAAAASAQDDITEHRNVIIPVNGGTAYRTGRCRPDDGLSFGQAVNADIQETTDTHAHKKNI